MRQLNIFPEVLVSLSYDLSYTLPFILKFLVYISKEAILIK